MLEELVQTQSSNNLEEDLLNEKKDIQLQDSPRLQKVESNYESPRELSDASESDEESDDTVLKLDVAPSPEVIKQGFAREEDVQSEVPTSETPKDQPELDENDDLSRAAHRPRDQSIVKSIELETATMKLVRNVRLARDERTYSGEETPSPRDIQEASPTPTPLPKDSSLSPLPSPKESSLSPLPSPKESILTPLPPKESSISPLPSPKESSLSPLPPPKESSPTPAPSPKESSPTPPPPLKVEVQESSPTPPASPKLGGPVKTTSILDPVPDKVPSSDCKFKKGMNVTVTVTRRGSRRKYRASVEIVEENRIKVWFFSSPFGEGKASNISWISKPNWDTISVTQRSSRRTSSINFGEDRLVLSSLAFAAI